MSLYSTYWYRVAEIKPRLRSHIRLYRHTYRGKIWYVLQDSSSSRQHRFNKSAYYIIGMMDGRKTVQQIWAAAVSSLGDEAPTQDEIIHLLGKLHAADVLQSNIPPDTMELFQRQEKHRSKWKQRLINPFALRFPLVDPDRFLVNWMFLVKPFLGRVGILLWLLVVGFAFVLTVVNWPILSDNIADRILNPQNLLILWFVYPAIKLLHELGHAFATRIWGGEVHEMGIMFLALTPIPYVEASASASFSDKHKRIAVAATGMAVELFVASLALFLWLNIESGRVSAITYNVMLIGGVSTLLFNGNPLLRYDGYYILADLIEIPNFSNRSARYLGYLLQHYIFGIKEAVSPVTAKGERSWFVVYGIASFFYRMFVLTVLALFISSKFFFVGILIAVWAICSQILLPLVRNGYRFYDSTGGRRRRTRFVTASAIIGISIVIFLFVIPVPLRTRAQGVCSAPEYSRVLAGTDCFISKIYVQDGDNVKSGDPLFGCEDPFLEAKVKILNANLKESEAVYTAEKLQSRVQREILREKIASAKAQLAYVHERENELIVRSPNQGIFVLLDSNSLMGHFIRQGDLLGYVMGASETVLVVVVNQSDIALVREHTKAIELRLSGHLDSPFTVNIDREIPAGSTCLPSRVLGTNGGGCIPVDPLDPDGLHTLNETFRFEIKLPVQRQKSLIGERVYALFDHGYEPIALQWYRAFRQLFLSRFHV